MPAGSPVGVVERGQRRLGRLVPAAGGGRNPPVLPNRQAAARLAEQGRRRMR
jgi:hypothetical protein